MSGILPKNKLTILWVALIVLGFVVVRAFEDRMFYDPLMAYFKGDYSSAPYPAVWETRMLINYLIRYAINTALSLALLHVLFRSREITVFAGTLFGLFFVVFLVAFILVWNNAFGEQKMALFYIRRFLIHPILILLFLPAFYVQVRSEKNNKS